MDSSPRQFQATVSAIERLASTFYLVQFNLTDANTIDFRAGQYVVFSIPAPKLRHTMSIASTPKRRDAIEVLQDVAPGGQGSQWMLHLTPGNPVTFTGPLGRFAVNSVSSRKKVFVATGCGIAPLRSMILDYLSSGGKEQVMLYWGLRHEEDMFWQEEFARLAGEYDTFRYLVTLSQPQDNWRGTRGRVTDHVTKEETTLAASEFYLCGNRQMIIDMRKQLADRNVPEDQIYTETFF